MSIARSEVSQQGSALIYILIAVGLLAAITTTMMSGGTSQNANTKGAGNEASLTDQLDLITSAVHECILTHPDQDSELTTTQQKNAPYPINPRDPYFTAQSAVPGAATNDEVANLRCPGDPGGAGPANQNHARIFVGASGKFLPQPPSGFTKWTYYNGADGVFLVTSVASPPDVIVKSIQAVDKKYNACQTDVIDRRGAASLPISSDITPGSLSARLCPADAVCFRYWFIEKATALGADAGCPAS